jgi:transmembrane sensor
MPDSSPPQPAALAHIQEEAAAWFARLHGDAVSTADRAAFAAWMQADPRHRSEFEILDRLWSLSAKLRPGTGKSTKRRQALGAAAGVVSVLLLLGLWLGAPRSGEALHTGPGERLHLRLADGSELDVGPDSELRIRMETRSRRIELAHGQIVVAVATDPGRPFEVRAGGGIVRDIGTRFAVDAEGARTQVTVADGLVEIELPDRSVTSPRVAAGQTVAYDRQGISDVHPADAGALLAWARGQLVFDATPLTTVIATLNRYRHVPIEALDPDLADIRISGVFRIDNEEAALRALAQVAPVEFIARAGKVEARRVSKRP